MNTDQTRRKSTGFLISSFPCFIHIHPWLMSSSSSGNLLPAFNGLVFPSPVKPKVLLRRLADDSFQSSGKPLRDGNDGIRTVFIFLGQNIILDQQFIAHW